MGAEMAEKPAGNCHHLLDELGEYLDGKAAAATLRRSNVTWRSVRTAVPSSTRCARRSPSIVNCPRPSCPKPLARLYKTLDLSAPYTEHTEE